MLFFAAFTLSLEMTKPVGAEMMPRGGLDGRAPMAGSVDRVVLPSGQSSSVAVRCAHMKRKDLVVFGHILRV